MLSQEEILKLKTYCQEITFKPSLMSAQTCIREGKYIWCTDWEIIEILKCLFLGEEAYRGDPPPNRLKNNPLWSKDDIVRKAHSYIEEFKTADAIIKHLREMRSNDRT